MFDRKVPGARDVVTDPLPGRRTRADRAVETRRKLIDAAARIVGEDGYANASVAKITALADIAQGTFYNYFASQQDLFDQLLPELGAEVLDFIRSRVAGEHDSFKREQIGFRAYFEFLAQRPEFYRILNEAETFAPKAFHDHMRNMADGFVRALARGQAKGELPGFDPRELEVIVYILLAARNYISYRYLFRDGRSRRLPSWVDRAYMKFLTGGMLYGGTTGRTHKPRRHSPTAPPMMLVEAADLRLTSPAPGQACIELDVSDACRDDCGNVRRSVLLELIETAASAAASSLAGQAVHLHNLSTGFPGTTASEGLVAVAEAVASGSAVHVGVAVRERSSARAIATAQAFYASDAGMDEKG